MPKGKKTKVKKEALAPAFMKKEEAKNVVILPLRKGPRILASDSPKGPHPLCQMVLLYLAAGTQGNSP